MADIPSTGAAIGGAGAPRPMRRRWPLSAPTTVVVLSGALTFVIFAIFGLLCWQGYWTVLQQAHDDTETAADIVAQETSWIVSSSLAVLDEVAQQTTNNPAAVDDLASAVNTAGLSLLPTEVTLSAYDRNGRLVSSSAADQAPERVDTLPFFAKIGSGEPWTISREVGRDPDSRPMLTISRRLTSGGAFIGVVQLAYSQEILDSMWATLKLGSGSTVSLIRDDGMIVGRHPELSDRVDLGDLPVFKTLTSSVSGTYESEASPADGVARIVGYQQVPVFHLIAVAGKSREATLAPLFSSIAIVLLLLVPIGVALVVGSIITAGVLRKSAHTQANLAAALAHNETLFREIHHRVKNNLQSVASLLQMQPIPPEVKTNMGQRIAAMSAVHEHIYRSNDFGNVRIKTYIETLIGNIRAGYGSGVEVIEDLEDLRIDKEAATPLGLIFNEVLSNAFKHAFRGGEGSVTVHLHDIGEGRGQMVVEDTGTAFDPDAPAKGIGRRLITALTMQLGGESRFERSATGGARFVVDFPLTPRDEARA